jgi:hypothetical protein
VSFLFPSQTITFDAAMRDLASGTPKARALAAHALGEVTAADERTRAADALIAALDDARAEVRCEAAASLGELGDPRAVPGLVKRLDDGDAAVRQCAAIALGSLRHADAWDALVTALREGPADLRFQAASSLPEIDPPKSYDVLVGALGDGDPQVLSAIALSLGAIGDGRATGHLARLLEHADRGVRFDAAYALSELGDARGRDALAAALAEAERAWDAACALERLASPADADALATAVGDRKAPPQVQIRAAGALLAIAPAHDKADAARRVLLAGLALRKPELRGLSIEELVQVGGAWAEDALAKMRTSRKGKDFVDVIDQALEKIRGREK